MSGHAVATPAPRNPAAPLRFAASGWLPAIALLLGLAAIIGLRWWATREGLDPLAVGLVFGLALGALAVVPRANLRGGVAAVPAVAAGISVGLALVGLVAAGAALGGNAGIPGLVRPAAPFLPWAAITIVVATAEEALLRGRLFDAARRAGGAGAALAVTTVAFALMHVPLYGWQVVPLDLAVGLGLGGLRLATGRVAAPAAAHVVADLATWWL